MYFLLQTLWFVQIEWRNLWLPRMRLLKEREATDQTGFCRYLRSKLLRSTRVLQISQGKNKNRWALKWQCNVGLIVEVWGLYICFLFIPQIMVAGHCLEKQKSLKKNLGKLISQCVIKWNIICKCKMGFITSSYINLRTP